MNNPTNPDYSVESASTSGPATARTSQPPEGVSLLKPLDTTLAPPSSLGPSRGTTPAFFDNLSEWNNEVFDPLGWTLDGLVDLPYPMGTQPMDIDHFGPDIE